ncbi:hypothetical protein HPP92_020570 [Vanilla planifolia]|uniref:Uncharacterized protein n=1 Tax=Vanilla planifolia TaxID=51239 RepID=A0A835UM68_VANPL|nr:hypothetical protein HPP92_020570 [Vanilla planifolia]
MTRLSTKGHDRPPLDYLETTLGYAFEMRRGVGELRTRRRGGGRVMGSVIMGFERPGI